MGNVVVIGISPVYFWAPPSGGSAGHCGLTDRQENRTLRGWASGTAATLGAIGGTSTATVSLAHHGPLAPASGSKDEKLSSPGKGGGWPLCGCGGGP